MKNNLANKDGNNNQVGPKSQSNLLENKDNINNVNNVNNTNNINNINNNFIGQNNEPLLETKKYNLPIGYRIIEGYKNWEGNTFFQCDCSYLEGPNSMLPTIFSIQLIFTPILLILIFNWKYLCDEFTVISVIIYIVLIFLSLFFLILVSFSDPGILRSYHFIKNPYYKIPERRKCRIFQLGYIKSFDFCGTCSIMRPERTHHCRNCDNCIEKMDHHCPWIGNCVGKRNYKYFYCFVIFTTLLGFYVAGMTIAHLVKIINDMKDENDKLPKELRNDHIVQYALSESIISLYIIVYDGFCVWFVTALFASHTYIVCSNKTTHEYLKGYIDNLFNPYSRTCLKNIRISLCSQIKKHSILDVLKQDKNINCEYDKTIYEINRRKIPSNINNICNNTIDRMFNNQNINYIGTYTNHVNLENSNLNINNYQDTTTNFNLLNVVNNYPLSNLIQKSIYIKPFYYKNKYSKIYKTNFYVTNRPVNAEINHALNNNIHNNKLGLFIKR